MVRAKIYREIATKVLAQIKGNAYRAEDRNRGLKRFGGLNATNELALKLRGRIVGGAVVCLIRAINGRTHEAT